MTVIIFVLILGLLVLVHELGHFVVARRNGITAHEFGFGFPPRALGLYRKSKGKWKVVLGNKKVESKNTIYSINWIPIGGFVKIKGEDGSHQDQGDSFSSKTPFVRSKVLIAGVAMNLLLAWILLSVVFMIGSDEDVSGKNYPNSRILITGVSKDSPAEAMGLAPGDEILSGKKEGEILFSDVAGVQSFIQSNKGAEIIIKVNRGGSMSELKGVPRAETIEGQGPLGISLAEVAFVKHPFLESFYLGVVEVWNILVMMAIFLKDLVVGKTEGAAVTGIIGIGIMTGQIIPLGMAPLLKFIAILSLNLAVINALPIPALDGGRVLFILIEKIKGSPVSEKIEQAFHSTGFVLLMILMIVVTFMDIVRNNLLDWFKNLF